MNQQKKNGNHFIKKNNKYKILDLNKDRFEENKNGILEKYNLKLKELNIDLIERKDLIIKLIKQENNQSLHC